MGKIKNIEPSAGERILQAAKEVFAQKGFAATRMQEIADHAGINKGLLHYYYKSKERLFRAVFEDAFTRFSRRLNDILASEMPLLEKLDSLVDEYLDMLLEHPNLPGFIVSELHTNSEEFIHELMNMKERPDPARLIMQVHLEAQAGRIRDVDPFHLVLSILSMCAFPFIARPLFQKMANIDDDMYRSLMQTRKKAVKDLLFHAIRIPDQSDKS